MILSNLRPDHFLSIVQKIRKKILALKDKLLYCCFQVFCWVISLNFKFDSLFIKIYIKNGCIIKSYTNVMIQFACNVLVVSC